MNETMTKLAELDATSPDADGVPRIGRSMTRIRLMTGRRLIGRLAIHSVAPGLELSHLDVLDAVRRAQSSGEVTVGMIADMLRIDPSRASVSVAYMVGRTVRCGAPSQAAEQLLVVRKPPPGQTRLGERRVDEP